MLFQKMLKIQNVSRYLAFYSFDLCCKVVVDDTFVSHQLDRLIEASSASSILDIITASGLPLPLTQEAVLVEASEVTCCITKC